MSNQMQPLISVLMTAYNRQQFIAEAIESVLASDYYHFELIIVDDCSKDKTQDIAFSYAKKDNRIRVYINESNLGDYSNRNQAAAYAKGEYLLYVDSDDSIRPDTMSYILRQFARFPEAGFSTLVYNQIIKEEYILDSHTAIKRHFFEKSFLHVGPGGLCIRSDFFFRMGKFPVQYGVATDMFFNLKMASNAKVLCLTYDYLTYRIHENQERNKKYAHLHDGYSYFQDCLKLPEIPLSLSERKYLLKKSKRRFVVNSLRYLIETKNVRNFIAAYKVVQFTFRDFLAAVFSL